MDSRCQNEVATRLISLGRDQITTSLALRARKRAVTQTIRESFDHPTTHNSSCFLLFAWKGSTMKKPLWWVHGSERLPESRAGVEPFGTPKRETWLGRAGLPGLAVFGLLCHLFIFWLLSW